MRIVKRALLTLAGVLAAAYLALVAFAYWPRAREALPVSALQEPGDRFVRVEGLDLRYREYGTRGAGRPELVLVHGFANSLQSWRNLVPYLEDCCHVFAVDLPGFGLSAKPAHRSYHNDTQGQALVAFARAVGATRPVFVGHSLGGTIALHAALQEPASAGLVLLNPGIINTGVPKMVEYQFFPLPRLSALQFGDRSFRARSIRGSLTDPSIVTPAVLDDLMLASRSEGYLEGMTSLMGQYRAGEEVGMLGQVRVPTLIIWGSLDRRPPGEPDELQQRIAGSQLVFIDNAGHYTHEEQPLAVADALVTALEDWKLARQPGPQPGPQR